MRSFEAWISVAISNFRIVIKVSVFEWIPLSVASFVPFTKFSFFFHSFFGSFHSIEMPHRTKRQLRFQFVCFLCVCDFWCLCWNASNEKFKLKCVLVLVCVWGHVARKRPKSWYPLSRNKFSILFELHDPNNTWTWKIRPQKAGDRTNHTENGWKTNTKWRDASEREIEKTQQYIVSAIFQVYIGFFRFRT